MNIERHSGDRVIVAHYVATGKFIKELNKHIDRPSAKRRMRQFLSAFISAFANVSKAMEFLWFIPYSDAYILAIEMLRDYRRSLEIFRPNRATNVRNIHIFNENFTGKEKFGQWVRVIEFIQKTFK